MANANLNFKIGYTVDKTGLESLKTGLKELQNLTLKDYLDINKGMKINEAKINLNELQDTVLKVQAALTKSFNSSLGSLNTSTLNNELNKIGLDKIYNDFNKAGTEGQYQFKRIAAEALTSNLRLKETHNILDEMGETLTNTIKWNAASTAMNYFQKGVQAAYNYVVKLDSSLNDIRVVTGKSADDMERFAQKATTAAKNLSASTRDITEGALIYYQQGDNDENALAKAEITQKAANVSQIDTAEASEYLTAIWNGYQAANQAAEDGMQVYEEYVDKLAAVAATTASDLQESSVAMSKVASAANSMGIDFDQLNAQIATIVSVTRQAPESVGTALKTIYARMGDLSVEGGTDEFGVSLGQVSGQLKDVGIDILDTNGDLRDMGTVIEEVAAKWQTWTDAQKQAVAIAMAGKRQYNNLVSLFENWDMYTDALNTSKNAMGTLQEQEDIYEERTSAHLQKLSTSFENLYDSIWDSDVFKTLIDALTDVVDLFTSLVDGIGGGSNALLFFGSVATKVFDKQIAKGLATFAQNRQNKKDNAQILKKQIDDTQDWAQSQGMSDEYGTTVKDLINRQKNLQDLYPVMSNEEINKANDLSKQLAQAQALKEKWDSLVETAREYAKVLKASGSDDFWKGQKEANTFLKNMKDIQKKSNGAVLSREEGLDFFKQAEDLMNNPLLGEKLRKSIKNQLNVTDKRTQIKGLNFLFDEENYNPNDEKWLKSYTKRYQNLINYLEQAIQEIKQKNAEIKGVLEAEDNSKDGVSESQKRDIKYKDILGDFNAEEQAMRNRQIAQAKVDIASAAMATISALNTIINLYDVWQDKDIDISQKISQTFTAIGGQAIMLMSNFDNLQTSFTVMAAHMGISTGALVGAFAGVVGAVGLLTVSFQAYEKAQKRQIESARAARDAALENYEELEKTEDLYQTYEKAYANYKQTGEGKSELISATGELCSALDEEIDNVALLAGNYELLNKRIQENRKEKLESTLKKDASDITSGAIALQKNVGSGFDDSIIDLGQFGQGVDDEIAESLANKLTEAGIEGVKLSDRDQQTGTRSLKITGLSDPEDFARAWGVLVDAFSEINGEIENASQSNGYQNITELLNNGKEDWSALSELMDKTENTAVNLVQSILSTEQDLDLEDINSIDSFANYKKKFIEKLKEQRGYENRDDDELEQITDDYLKSFDNVAQYVESLDLKDKFIDIFGKGKEDSLSTEAKAFLEEIQDNNDWSLLATIKIDEDSSLESIKVGYEYAKKQAETELTQDNLNSINTVIDFYNRDDSKEITSSEQEEFDSALGNIEPYLKATEGINGMSSAWEEFQMAQQEGSLASIEYLEDLIDKNGQYANKTVEDYQKMTAAQIDYLNLQKKDLENAKEELNNKISEYKKTNDKDKKSNIFSSEAEYKEAVAQVEEYSDEIDQLSIQIGTLQDQFENGDWQMQVDMGNVDEILSIGDTILSQSEKIQKAAELIGEGYRVAADDAEALNNILPDIMENANVLADGTIQLSQETVQSLLGNQAEILNGDTNTALGIIDNQIELLKAKKESAEAELKIADAVANGSVDIDREQMLAQATNEEELIKYLVQSGVDKTTAEKAALSIMEQNMDSYNNYVADAYGDISNNAANSSRSATSSILQGIQQSISGYQSLANAAAAAATAFQSGSVLGGMFDSISGSAMGIASSYIKQKNALTKGLQDYEGIGITAKKPTGSDWSSDVKTNIDKYQKAINQLTILKSKLLSSQKNAQAALDGASSGAGGKGSSGSGGSGGNGGSSEKEDEADYIDQLEDEYDTYHDIDLEISKIETDLKRIQDRQEKLSGKDLIDNLNKQLDILEKQKQAYKDKIELARMESDALKEALKAQGVTFTDDGYISNYYSALQNKLNYTNGIIAKYNTMSAKEQEAYKDTVEQAKEDYENFKDQIENYDDLISNTIPDLEDQIQEATDQQIEIQIEKFITNVEISLDTSEAERTFNDFKKKVIDQIKDDDIFGNAKSNLEDLMSYFDTNDMGSGPIQSLTDQLTGTIEQLKQIESGGWGSVYGDNQAKALEDLKNYYEQLMTQLEDSQELIDEIKNSYLDMIDEAIDKFDEQVDQYDYINDLIEHDIELMKLMYGDDAYGEMESYYAEREANNNKELDFLKQRVTYAKEMMDAETDPEAKEKWQEEWEKALTSLNEKVNDSVQNLIDKYVNSINKVFDELNDKVSNGLGLDYINDEWDLINKNADAYLDTINGMYEIQKLEDKYLDAIDQTDNISNQQKLNDLMNEQLSMLRDKEKLTQYDVDRANALYEIALKEIALQDAQQNKSKMRLRRDSQGNYSYQYVSDQDSIAQAQQELAEAQNSLYNLDKDKYKQNLNDIYSTYSEFQQKLLELYSDQTISAEERQQKEALLVEQYGELINGLVEQNENIKNNLRESAFDELANMYEVDVDNFKNMSDEEQDILMNSLIPQWESGIQKMTDIFAGDGGFIPSCSEAFDQLKELTKDYQDSLDELESAAGVNFDSISSGYDNTISQVEDLINSNDELIDRYNTEIDAIRSIIEQMDTLISRYTTAKNEAIEATKAAYGYWQTEQTKNKNTGTGGSADGGSGSGSDSSSTGSNTDSGSGGSSNGGSTGSGSSASGGATAADGVLNVGDTVTYTGGLYYYDSQGHPPTGKRGPGKKVTVVRINNGAPYPISVKSNDSAYGWLKKEQLTGYDTGGYTGDWNDDDGRLALLHQKELILKDSDTERMLSAVKVVRSMGSLLDSFNSSMQNRLSGMLSYLSLATSGIPNFMNGSDSLEQNVHIDATFPNATNAKEIEDAFNNLVNIASQHAYNTKR